MPALRIMPSRELLLMALAECGSQLNAAKLFGCSADLMQQWCRILRIKGDKYTRRMGAVVVSIEKLTDSEKSLVKALKGSMTATEAAVKFDTSRRTVSRIWAKDSNHLVV